MPNHTTPAEDRAIDNAANGFDALKTIIDRLDDVLTNAQKRIKELEKMVNDQEVQLQDYARTVADLEIQLKDL